MNKIQLQNEELTVSVKTLGAELCSLIDNKTGEEFMWGADPDYWGRCSPILFPFVGGTVNKQYRTKGKTYEMKQHGFARDMEFEVKEGKTDTEVWFILSWNEKTYELYPYEFILEIGYRLEKRKLIVCWKVINPADEALYFSIGGHPAFCSLVKEGEARRELSLKFGNAGQIITTSINEEGLATDDRETYVLQNGILPVTPDLFSKDALVIENNQIQEISLCRDDGRDYVKVAFDAPLVGVWSVKHGKAPFICIEPWYGRCDHTNFRGELKEREWGNSLDAHEEWNAQYVIQV